MFTKSILLVSWLLLWASVAVSVSVALTLRTKELSLREDRGFNDERMEAARRYLTKTWRKVDCQSLRLAGNHYEKLIFIAMAANLCPDNAAAYSAAVVWLLGINDLGTQTVPSVEEMLPRFLDYALQRHLAMYRHSNELVKLEKTVIGNYVAQSNLGNAGTGDKTPIPQGKYSEFQEKVTDTEKEGPQLQENPDLEKSPNFERDPDPDRESDVESDTESITPPSGSDMVQPAFCTHDNYGPDDFQVMFSIAVAAVICKAGSKVSRDPKKWLRVLSRKFSWDKDSNTDSRRFLEYALRRSSGDIELDADLVRMEKLIASEHRLANTTQDYAPPKPVPQWILEPIRSNILRD